MILFNDITLTYTENVSIDNHLVNAGELRCKVLGLEIDMAPSECAGSTVQRQLVRSRVARAPRGH